MRCPSCGAELPDDAAFCIECGLDLQRAANTSATVALPRPSEDTVACRNCGADNPSYALFCVRCGRRIGEPPPPPLVERPPVPTLTPPATLAAPSRPHQRTRQSWRRQRFASGVGLMILLIGIGSLLLLKFPFWPAILIVIGLSSFLSQALSGSLLNGLRSTLWLFGIAFLIMVPKLWWPGIMVLVGLSIGLEMLRRSVGRSW